MTWDCWARPYRAVLAFGGDEHEVAIARLSLAQRTDLRRGMAQWMRDDGPPPDDTADPRALAEARNAWFNETIAAYVRPVTPWESDGYPVGTGEDLILTYQDEYLFAALVMTLWIKNEVPEAVRKNLSSPLDFQRSLLEAAKGTGSTPAAAADSADAPGSVSPVAATARSASASSGTTAGIDASSRAPVPSARSRRTSTGSADGSTSRTSSMRLALAAASGDASDCPVPAP